MCGRFEISLDANETIRYIIEQARSIGYEVKEGEIFPSDYVALLIAGRSENGLSIVSKQWGLENPHEKHRLMINARQETVLEKVSFSRHFPLTRCVFPTTGFYEWDLSANKTKTLFRLPDKSALYLAGFYRGDEAIILTTAATPSFAKVHARMPLIIAEEDIRQYLHDPDFAKACLTKNMPELVGQKVNLNIEKQSQSESLPLDLGE